MEVPRCAAAVVMGGLKQFVDGLISLLGHCSIN